MYYREYRLNKDLTIGAALLAVLLSLAMAGVIIICVCIIGTSASAITSMETNTEMYTQVLWLLDVFSFRAGK